MISRVRFYVLETIQYILSSVPANTLLLKIVIEDTSPSNLNGNHQYPLLIYHLEMEETSKDILRRGW